MKLNWGTGIAITLMLFAGLMSFMVYKATQQDFDLVSEDYYAEEIEFQEVIDQKVNASKLRDKASLELTNEGIYLILPADLMERLKDISVHMYYEQEADQDFQFTEEKTMANRFEVPFRQLYKGKWIAKVKVRCEGVDYYFDPQIRL